MEGTEDTVSVDVAVEEEPVETSPAPVEPSGAPVEPSGAPVETSPAPVETSTAPLEEVTAETEVAVPASNGDTKESGDTKDTVQDDLTETSQDTTQPTEDDIDAMTHTEFYTKLVEQGFSKVQTFSSSIVC